MKSIANFRLGSGIKFRAGGQSQLETVSQINHEMLNEINLSRHTTLINKQVWASCSCWLIMSWLNLGSHTLNNHVDVF